MSEYFRVLKRIEGDQPDIEVQPASAAGAARPGDQPLSPPAPPQPAPIAASLTADARVAFVRLFDNIRTLANGNAVRTLVFAGAERVVIITFRGSSGSRTTISRPSVRRKVTS